MANQLKTEASRRRWRPLWLKVHLYLALTVGFFFVLLGLTGSVNVFHVELAELGLPTLERRGQGEAPVSLDNIMANIRQAHPQRQDRWTLYMPGYGQDYLWTVYPNPQETADEVFAPLLVQVDPHTGKLVAEHFWGETFETLIYSFHATWLMWQLGDSDSVMIAHKTITFLGLLLLISAVTGLYLWWPRRGTFLKAMGVQRQGRFPRIHFELHRLVGFYSSAVLLVLAFTGFNFGYGEYLKSAMAVVSPVEAEHFQAPEGLKSTPTLEAKPIAIDQAVAIADRIFPEAELRRLATPDGLEGVYAIEKRQPGEANRRHPRSKVWIEQYTGEVLAVEDPTISSPSAKPFSISCGRFTRAKY